MSLATERALEEALALGDEVVAVAVAVHHDEVGQGSLEALRRDWAAWDPGVPLEVLQTEYTSVVKPIVAFIDAARRGSDDQIVVLIPVIVPDRLRHRVLHNHLDVVLASALRRRTDVVVARVPMAVDAGSASRTVGGEGDRGVGLRSPTSGRGPSGATTSPRGSRPSPGAPVRSPRGARRRARS